MFKKCVPTVCFAAVTIAATVYVRADAYAASCSIPTVDDQGDSFYMSGWGCAQANINDMWSRFDFDSDDWNEGFGYEEPCNVARPLARTFNALMVLGYSHTSAPTCNTSGNVLDWSYCWAGKQLDELDARCGSGTPDGDEIAYTLAVPGWDQYTNLYWPFFYGQTVVNRAATIFHEARHGNGCIHNGNRCDRGSSCDSSWESGCLAQSTNGANTFEVNWLIHFVQEARWISDPMKASAIKQIDDLLDQSYDNDPCFRLDSNGNAYNSC